MTSDSHRLLLPRRVLLLVALPGWCALLLIVRWVRSGHPAFRFLAWNLILAAAPAVASALFVRAVRHGSGRSVRALWFGAWLLFLPNAPYILTDFIHLHPRPPVPFWYDIAVWLSFAGAGLVLGYSSVADVQAVVARRAGTRAGWALAVVALMLSGLGIYAGRFLRWNSWDALVHPHRILQHVRGASLNPGDHPRSLGVTLVYGLGLVMGYVMLRIAVPQRPLPNDRDAVPPGVAR
ncbi:MAG TPA: DUF1361 domain-containing protein [Candidatus Acidoferrales bacterium]|nr:DUF1361 domain-containing protein [Candidatus Acidoferrales bacterium]